MLAFDRIVNTSFGIPVAPKVLTRMDMDAKTRRIYKKRTKKGM
jgi:hypothetical protein